MRSIDMIENLVKSILPKHTLPKLYLGVHAWNRTKEDKSDPEMINQTDAYGNVIGQMPRPVSRTNQMIAKLALDINSYEWFIRREKANSGKHEAGIGAAVYTTERTRLWGSNSISLYMGLIDFNPGLTEDNRHTRSFWNDMYKNYSGKRLYVFNTGNAHHGVLNTVLDYNGIIQWMNILEKHEEVVDQKWVRFALNHDHMGVLRTTSGYNRPEPKLLKYINL